MRSWSSVLKELRETAKNISLFLFLIVGFHFLYRFWAYKLDYWPIYDYIMPIFEFLRVMLYKESVWVLTHLTSYDFKFIFDKYKIIYVPDNSYVAVTRGCTGFKPFMEWIFLMTIFPGPWKKKLWFIPLGLIITHLVNILRITGLSVAVIYFPHYWEHLHDYVFRPLFYVVMFVLWLWWVEKLAVTKKN